MGDILTTTYDHLRPQMAVKTALFGIMLVTAALATPSTPEDGVDFDTDTVVEEVLAQAPARGWCTMCEQRLQLHSCELRRRRKSKCNYSCWKKRRAREQRAKDKCAEEEAPEKARAKKSECQNACHGKQFDCPMKSVADARTDNSVSACERGKPTKAKCNQSCRRREAKRLDDDLAKCENEKPARIQAVCKAHQVAGCQSKC